MYEGRKYYSDKEETPKPKVQERKYEGTHIDLCNKKEFSFKRDSPMDRDF